MLLVLLVCDGGCLTCWCPCITYRRIIEIVDRGSTLKIVEHIFLLKANEDLSDEEEKDMVDYLYTAQYLMGGIVAISLGSFFFFFLLLLLLFQSHTFLRLSQLKYYKFVLTSSVKKSFEMVLLALNQRWPVLLHGPTGSGKTALISKLAQVTGNQDGCIDFKQLKELLCLCWREHPCLPKPIQGPYCN